MSTIIEINGLKNYFDEHRVHDDLNLTIESGETVGLIGGSGCGKTTLLRSILMLQPVTAGSIKVFDQEVVSCPPQAALMIQQRWGVAFQHNALFSGLTVAENIMFPLREFTDLPYRQREEIALLKLALVGLEKSVGDLYPAELSGGMQKRAALARALAMDPELLFLDEPTSGLDPSSAGAFDELIIDLRKALGLTVVMVTHDLDSLWHATDKVAFLGEGKVLALLPIAQLVKEAHPMIQAYFAGPRGVSRE